MSGENGNSNGRRPIGQWITIGITAIALFGSVIGVYSTIHSDIADNRRAIDDIKRELSSLERRTEAAKERQDNYNAELRSRIVEADKEIRESIRLLVSKLIDKGNP
jgi:hypothetical protein